MLPIFTLIEVGVVVSVVWFILSQIVIPTIGGVPLFPWLRRRKSQKLLRDLAEAEQRRYELNLLAAKKRAERLLNAQEAAISAAESEGEKK